jgi:hypothetical protein
MTLEWGKIGGAIVTAAVLGGGAAYLTVRSELLNLGNELRLLKEQHPHQYPTVSASVSAFPKGAIVAWYGPSASVPPGWVICNGKNGTPDLRDRFLKGTGDFARSGNRGGSSSHSHSASVHLPDSNRKGSDSRWGETPWRDGPNPVYTQTVNVSVSTGDNLPPFVEVLFIMKE